MSGRTLALTLRYAAGRPAVIPTIRPGRTLAEIWSAENGWLENPCGAQGYPSSA